MGTAEIILILLILLLPVCGLLVIYFSLRARHKERMTMIEKGMQPPQSSDSQKWRTVLAKTGIVITGLGVGLLIITLFIAVGLSKVVNNGPSAIGILIVCTGVAMIIASRYDGRKE